SRLMTFIAGLQIAAGESLLASQIGFISSTAQIGFISCTAAESAAQRLSTAEMAGKRLGRAGRICQRFVSRCLGQSPRGLWMMRDRANPPPQLLVHPQQPRRLDRPKAGCIARVTL